MRRLALCALGLVLFAARPATAADGDKAKRKLAHEVNQALLYVNMNIPERARETLEGLIAEEPGKSDGIAWLALSKAYYAEKNLDEAGRTFRRAEALGAKTRLAETKWAQKYHDDFRELVGSVRVRDAGCPAIKFRARLATPMVNREKRALLEGLRGWRKKELERRTDRPVFLPAGKYKLGEVKVVIIPGEDTSITAAEIGAECTALPQIASAKGAGTTGGAGTVTGTGPGPAQPESGGFLADNWLWLVVGAVAVAGGATAAAVVATQDSGPDTFRLTF